jgi:hypothetical protein
MPSATPGTTRGGPVLCPDAITRTGSVSGRVDDDGNNATWSDHVTDEEYNAAARNNERLGRRRARHGPETLATVAERESAGTATTCLLWTAMKRGLLW